MANSMQKASAADRVAPASDAKRASTGMSPAPATVECINVGLMLLALIVASAIPFELFLFAYAVLGPLHYASEISWLFDRRFFSAASAAEMNGVLSACFAKNIGRRVT